MTGQITGKITGRLWPRSLIGQLILAVAVTLFVAQAINLALLARGQRQQALAHGAGMAVARIIDGLEGDRRTRTDRHARVPRILISDHRMALPLPSQSEPALADNVKRLLAEAGITAQDVTANALLPLRDEKSNQFMGRTVVVRARIDGRYFAVRSRMPGDGRGLRGFLYWQTLTLYLVLLVPILFIAWRAARPLRALTRAARADSVLGDAPPVEERGPSDVRDLIAAFNAYRARIQLMLADKDRMLGAVGHDLRTPLASLRVRVEAVADENLRDKMIGTIDEMTAMLVDILALARAGSGKEAADSYDVGALMADAADDYRAMGKAVTGPGTLPELPLLTGRSLLVRRALRNLIDNALVYAGSAMLAMEYQGGIVRLIVRDEGPGIDPARLADLMEPFARGEASRNRATGGAGLGLAIASTLAEGEGGRVLLANRADTTGLEAVIELPLPAPQPLT